MKYFLVIIICLSTAAFAKNREDFNAYEVIKQAKEQNIELSKKDKEILQIGRVSTIRYIGGGVVGTYIGFGSGHSIQGTWDHKGWIFTAGGLGSLAYTASQAPSCFRGDNVCSDSFGLGLTLVVAFRIWEIFDVWAGVPRYHNKQDKILDAIKDQPEPSSVDKNGISFRFAPVFSPVNGAGVGFVGRF